MYIQRNIEARSCNHCCSGKAASISYSECVSEALVIWHAKHMHLIFIAACPTVLYFSTLTRK